MTQYHSKRQSRVGEPVQVYLAPRDRQRLERLTERLSTTKSGVLRQALETLERQLLDPEQHPILELIGLGGSGAAARRLSYDVAREHDRFFAETEPGILPRRGSRRRGR